MEKNSQDKSLLLGVGLDNKDGHTRITKGDNFRLLGGSKDTHEQMQETAIKFNEELSKKKKRLEEINKDEFAEIADKVGLKSLPNPNNN